MGQHELIGIENDTYLFFCAKFGGLLGFTGVCWGRTCGAYWGNFAFCILHSAAPILHFALTPLRGLFLLLARHSMQAPSALTSCVGSAFCILLRQFCILHFAFCILLPFRFQHDIRHNHLLHRDAAVLEGVAVVADIAICIVVVDQEVVVVGKNITRREV